MKYILPEIEELLKDEEVNVQSAAISALCDLNFITRSGNFILLYQTMNQLLVLLTNIKVGHSNTTAGLMSTHEYCNKLYKVPDAACISNVN